MIINLKCLRKFGYRSDVRGITRGQMERRNREGSGLCCLGCSFGSARSHPGSTAQTAGRCSPPRTSS